MGLFVRSLGIHKSQDRKEERREGVCQMWDSEEGRVSTPGTVSPLPTSLKTIIAWALPEGTSELGVRK